jgi:hypothetical protein
MPDGEDTLQAVGRWDAANERIIFENGWNENISME